MYNISVISFILIPRFTSINHAELTVIFATPTHIPSLLKLVPKCPKLKMIVAMDPLPTQTKAALSAWGETLNVQVKEQLECASIVHLNHIKFGLTRE